MTNQFYDEWLNKLPQEDRAYLLGLIRKDTVNKPMLMQLNEPEYMCNVCGNKTGHIPNYCKHCGQKLKD